MPAAGTTSSSASTALGAALDGEVRLALAGPRRLAGAWSPGGPVHGPVVVTLQRLDRVGVWRPVPGNPPVRVQSAEVPALRWLVGPGRYRVSLRAAAAAQGGGPLLSPVVQVG